MRRKVPDTWWGAIVVGVVAGSVGGATAALADIWSNDSLAHRLFAFVPGGAAGFVVVVVTRARITIGMEELVSEGLRLGAHFARPAGVTRVPGLLVLPGFPRGAGGAACCGDGDMDRAVARGSCCAGPLSCGGA